MRLGRALTTDGSCGTRIETSGQPSLQDVQHALSKAYPLRRSADLHRVGYGRRTTPKRGPIVEYGGHAADHRPHPYPRSDLCVALSHSGKWKVNVRRSIRCAEDVQRTAPARTASGARPSRRSGLDAEVGSQ